MLTILAKYQTYHDGNSLLFKVCIAGTSYISKMLRKCKFQNIYTLGTYTKTIYVRMYTRCIYVCA